MTKFSKGDYVEIISSPYSLLGPSVGERGRIETAIGLSFGDGHYEVRSDTIKDDRYPSQTWPFFEEELKLVEE